MRLTLMTPIREVFDHFCLSLDLSSTVATLREMRIAALLGNGCSIPYNADLAMGPLTERILAALAPGDGAEGAVSEALQQLAAASTNLEAARIGVFEGLFGPLERLGRGLEALEQLATLLAPTPDFSDPLRQAHDMAHRLRQVTLGTALHVVAHLTTGQGAAAQQPLLDLVQWLFEESGDEDEVRIFTLNYDALVDGAALQVAGQEMVSDMAQGFGAQDIEILPDATAPAYALRDDDELPRRIILYHLHGSLQWLRRGEALWKVADLDDLRDCDFWGQYGAGDALVEPVVILADQKVQAVDVDPFDWAYRRFETAFLSADGLLIAGYGFGDEPVNRVLKGTLVEAESPVICIDRADNHQELRDRIHAVVPGLDDDRLLLHTNGIEGVVPDLGWN